MKKRILCLVIISAMIAVFFPAVNAEKNADDEQVTLIVEVKGDAALETDEAVLMGAAEYNETEEAQTQTEKILSLQEKVKADIKNKVSKKAEFGFTYTNVLNGFSVTVNKSDMDKIKALPNVENVSVSQKHKPIEPIEPTEPSDDTDIEMFSEISESSGYESCCEMINVPYMHERGYKGQGQAIAIIDTELDVNHKFFSSPIENPKYSKDDIKKMIKEKYFNADISANQIWKSNKIPFAYNYESKNSDVYNNDYWEIHGSHVAGIAAGKNGTRADGTSFSGVAPETQIIFMSATEAIDNYDIRDDTLIAAIDDASKMDIAAINMSFLSYYVHTDKVFEKIIDTAVNAGILISACAGNEDRFFIPEDIDCSTSGIPSNISAATSVASSKIGTGEISSFSSWGTNASLELKPEITAPGGDIYSSVPDDKYEEMSGTSMAAPHIAGAAALIRQYIEANYQGKYANPAPFIENLMMSTAKILYYDEENKIPYSPRNQGAGQLDLKAAVTTPVILKGDNGKTKISLKDKLTNTFNIEFTAENMTNSDVTYDTVDLSVITDNTDKYNQVEGMKKLKLTENLPESITVPANGSTVISCTVTLDETELAENSEIFTNGFFIDGFVKLSDSSNTVPQVSIPYTGFYGDWTKAPVFEEQDFTDGFEGNTRLGSDTQECLFAGFFGRIPQHSCWKLGWNMIASESSLYEFAKEWSGEKYAGYSPNGDGIYDFLCVAITPKRTAENAVIKIENSKGETIFEKQFEYFEKNWVNCVDLYDRFPDGDYVVMAEGTLPYEGAQRESIQMHFYVDTEYPVITSYSEKEADGKKYVDISASDNRYLMGFAAYGKNADSEEVKVYSPTTTENIAEAEIDVTEIVSNLRVYAVDFAGNATKYTEELSPSPSATVEPTATPTASPTSSPTPTPKTGDRIEFERLGNVVSAKLIFEKTAPPDESDIRLIVAYKDNGELKCVEMPSIIDMTAGFVIPEKYKDCEIIVYAWDKNMKPLMKSETLLFTD